LVSCKLVIQDFIELFLQESGCSNRPGICPDGTVCDENADCILPPGYNTRFDNKLERLSLPPVASVIKLYTAVSYDFS
jgi:hypothetical protein